MSAAPDVAQHDGALAVENGQLRRALASRIVIEQAKGVLGERYGLDVDGAFDLLRRAARSDRVRIHALAASVQPGAPTPATIERLAHESERPTVPREAA